MGSYTFKTPDHRFTSFMGHLSQIFFFFFYSKKKSEIHTDFWVWNLRISFGWITDYAGDEKNMTCTWGVQRQGEEGFSIELQ